MSELGRRAVVVIGGLFFMVGLLFWVAPPMPSSNVATGMETCGWLPAAEAFRTDAFTYCTEAGRSRFVTGVLVMAAAAARTAWSTRYLNRPQS